MMWEQNENGATETRARRGFTCAPKGKFKSEKYSKAKDRCEKKEGFRLCHYNEVMQYSQFFEDDCRGNDLWVLADDPTTQQCPQKHKKTKSLDQQYYMEIGN